MASRDGDRFAELNWRATDHGAILLEEASAWLECSIYQQVAAGDHDLVLMRVHDVDADSAVSPLVFHASQFRRSNCDPGDAIGYATPLDASVYGEYRITPDAATLSGSRSCSRYAQPQHDANKFWTFH